MDPKQFGPKLRALREAAGLSQKELAEVSGLSQNGISQWERGTREPSWGAVLALAEALGVDCRAFMGHGRPKRQDAP
jgi:transcriptional regulator with XRE-family HTH domain